MALFHSQAQRHVINVFLAMKHFHIRCQVKRNDFHCYSDISSVSLFHVKFKQLVLLIECWNLAFFLSTHIKINKNVSIQLTNEPQHLDFQQCGMCDQQSKLGAKIRNRYNQVIQSKGSDNTAHTRSLIRAFASRLNIL